MPLSPQEGNGCLTPSKCLIMSSCVLFMNKNHLLMRDRPRDRHLGEMCLITCEYSWGGGGGGGGGSPRLQLGQLIT